MSDNKRIILRADSEGNWSALNPPLAGAEPIVVLDLSGQAAKLKIGGQEAGINPNPSYNDLPSVGGNSPRPLQRGAFVYDYEPGTYGEGLIVALFQSKLYQLAEGTARPFDSSDILAETAATQWVCLTPDAPKTLGAAELLFQVGNVHDDSDKYVHLLRMPVLMVEDLTTRAAQVDSGYTVELTSETLNGHYHVVTVGYLPQLSAFWAVSVQTVHADGTTTDDSELLVCSFIPVGEPQSYQFQLVGGPQYRGQAFGLFSFGATLAARIFGPQAAIYDTQTGSNNFPFNGYPVRVYSTTSYYVNYQFFGYYIVEVAYRQNNASFVFTNLQQFNRFTQTFTTGYMQGNEYWRMVGSQDGGFRGVPLGGDDAYRGAYYRNDIVVHNNALWQLTATGLGNGEAATGPETYGPGQWDKILIGAGSTALLVTLYGRQGMLNLVVNVNPTDYASLADPNFVAQGQTGYFFQPMAYANTYVTVPIQRNAATNSFVLPQDQVYDTIGFGYTVLDITPLLAGAYVPKTKVGDTLTLPGNYQNLVMGGDQGFQIQDVSTQMALMTIATSYIAAATSYGYGFVLTSTGLTFQIPGYSIGLQLVATDTYYQLDSLLLGQGAVHVQVQQTPLLGQDVTNKQYVDNALYPVVDVSVRDALTTADWSSGQPVPAPADLQGNPLLPGVKVFDALYRYELMPDLFYEFAGAPQWVRSGRV